jgi:MauM/NapG family ferredoxin protein
MAKKLLSRKEFLREAFHLFRRKSDTTEMNRGTEEGIILPPNAVSLELYLKKCNQCYQCVSVCPHEAIRVWRNENSSLFGFPVIVPREQPCLLCEDLPCVKSCDTGALIRQEIPNLNAVAVIHTQRCLAYQGHFCITCVNSCPLTGQAIFRDLEGKPVINSQVCTGCGICEAACPTEKPAIRVKMKNMEGV